MPEAGGRKPEDGGRKKAAPPALNSSNGLSEAAKAAPYLRAGLNPQVFLNTKTLPRDPWFDPLRGQPEFEALWQESTAKQ